MRKNFKNNILLLQMAFLGWCIFEMFLERKYSVAKSWESSVLFVSMFFNFVWNTFRTFKSMFWFPLALFLMTLKGTLNPIRDVLSALSAASSDWNFWIPDIFWRCRKTFVLIKILLNKIIIDFYQIKKSFQPKPASLVLKMYQELRE